jgi:hypothetical protein
MPAFLTILNSCFFLVPRIAYWNQTGMQLNRNGGVAQLDVSRPKSEAMFPSRFIGAYAFETKV